MESIPKNSEDHLLRLTRYFAARLEHYRSLEDLFRNMDPANVVADGLQDRV